MDSYSYNCLIAMTSHRFLNIYKKEWINKKQANTIILFSSQSKYIYNKNNCKNKFNYIMFMFK